MTTDLGDIVDLIKYPLDDPGFQAQCKNSLDQTGALVMAGFLRPGAISTVQREGQENKHLAYFTEDQHNIYLTPPDPDFAMDHPRNRLVSSSKGCITSDQIPRGSPLVILYDSNVFREFLCQVLGETALYEYADPLSSINLHYADQGRELGWHYDNSSFAITLMIQAPAQGGKFEYVRDVRDADRGEMNFTASEKILDGSTAVDSLTMDAGTLVLFRGRNSMHRVTPVQGSSTRMLVVLAYNTEPGISLSESARMTFYGRLS